LNVDETIISPLFFVGEDKYILLIEVEGKREICLYHFTTEGTEAFARSIEKIQNLIASDLTSCFSLLTVVAVFFSIFHHKGTEGHKGFPK